LDLLEPDIFAADELPHAGRHAFATAVHGEHGGVVEGRGEECARLMREMMLDEVPFELVLAVCALKALAQMVRRAVEQLPFRVGYVAQKKRVPRRCGRVGQPRAGWIER